jgi:steroid delta-isomerase-like uncharacterized protein
MLLQMPRRRCAALAIVLLGGCGSGPAAPPTVPSVVAPAVSVPAVAPAPAQVTPVTAAPLVAAPPTLPPQPALSDLERTNIGNWLAAFNAHDLDKLALLYAERAVQVGPFADSAPREGRARIAASLTSLFLGFGDVKVAPVRFFQKRDVVVVEHVTTGTNTGEFKGAATNKKIGVHGCEVFWFDESGAIVRQESFSDEVTLLRQLGKWPGKAPESALVPSTTADWIVATGTPEEDALVEAMKSTWPATWSERDLTAYGTVLNDDSERIDFAVPSDVKGRVALVKDLQLTVKAVPDLNATIDKAWGFAPGVVVSEFTTTGTLRGSLHSIKATNKPITYHGLEIDELKDGKLQRSQSFADGAELLAAAGALPKHKSQPEFGLIGLIDTRVAPSPRADDWGDADDASNVGLGHLGTIGMGDPSNTPQRPASGKGAPLVRQGPVTVNGRLPPEVVERILRQNVGRLRLCYESGRSSNAKLEGRVTVKFVIDRAGSVPNVADGGSDLPDQGVVRCVQRAYTGLQFPQPDSGIVTVVASVMFSPGK